MEEREIRFGVMVGEHPPSLLAVFYYPFPVVMLKSSFSLYTLSPLITEIEREELTGPTPSHLPSHRSRVDFPVHGFSSQMGFGF